MMTRPIVFALMPLLFMSIAGLLPAQSEDEIKERMKQRYRSLFSLVEAQKIGETAGGFIEAVKPEYLNEKVDSSDPKTTTIKALLEAENSDRRTVYDQIAKRTNVTPEAVAARAAERSFKKAAPEHFLKTSSGKWVQKKELE